MKRIIFIKILTNTIEIKNANDLITDMLRNKKPYPMKAELFIRGKKINTSFVFQVSGNLFILYSKLLD